MSGVRFQRWPVALLALSLIAAGGCGSDDDSATSSQATTKAAPAKIPAALLGTYTTTLRPKDIPPNPPPELTHGSKTWKLTIAKTGGVDNGPVFGIANAELGSLEGPSFSVSGDRVLLHREECGAAGGDPFYENEYRYTLRGKALTFTKVKNLCPDNVVQTILTSEPWVRTGG
jgi:hypothetical protein